MGLGSLWGSRSMIGSHASLPRALASLLIVLAISGLYCIRASRLFFSPGELIGPLFVSGLLLLSEAPCAFASGYLFGALSRNQTQPLNPYGIESFGALLGAFVTFACVLLYRNNITIIALASVPFVFFLIKRPKLLAPALAAIALKFFMNASSMHWKYPFPFSGIVYGREGEIVSIKTGNDVTAMLNGALYKSTAEKPFLEQAVHVPLSARPFPQNVLVVFDKGHCNELAKYPGVIIDCLESEPLLALPGCIISAPESFRTEKHYDAVFLGSGIPQTAAANRLYTVSFFKRMKSLMTDSGIFSFTLPLSENYLSPAENRMSDVLKSTLAAVFKHVLVFPGNGFTFMDIPISIGKKPQVKTDYLESSILPSVTAERIAAANKKPSETMMNTSNKPLSLLLGLTLWIELFKGTWPIVALLLVMLLFASILILPKTKDMLSIGSTGFAAGIYSVALLMLYQSTYGLLYSRVSLLLCCLTCGFMIGTLLKRLPFADLLVGIYCIASLGLLSFFPYPPALLFFAAHLGIGVLAGGQFASIKNSSMGTIYAADCVGGALGMALTIVIIPLFGVWAVAGGLCAIKCIVWFATSRAGSLEKRIS